MPTLIKPLVLLVALGALGLTPVLAEAPREKPLPTTKIELRIGGQPLKEIAKLISEKADVEVELDPVIEEWKATIAFQGPLNTLLASLCENFSLVLEPRPRLRDRPRVRLRLSEEASRRLAERERRQLVKQQQDAELLSQQIEHLLRNIEQLPDHQPDENTGTPLSGGAKPLLRLIGSLGPDAIRQLSRSQPLPSPPPGVTLPADQTPRLSLPVSGLGAHQRMLLKGFLEDQQRHNAGNTVGKLLQDGLQRLDGATLQFWNLNRGGAQMLWATLRFPGMEWTPDFPFIAAPTVPDPVAKDRQQPDERGARGEAAMGAGRPPDPKAGEPRELQIRVSLKIDQGDYSDVALAIAESARLNLVADFFTLRERFTLSAKDRPLAEVLNQVTQTFRVDRHWKDSVLSLRRPDWDEKVFEEPPAEVLDRLIAELKPGEPLSVKTCAFAAARLTRSQIIGMGRWHQGQRSLLPEVGRLLNGRDLYVWLGTLSETQLSKVEDAGLHVGSLSRQQQQALEALVRTSMGAQDLRWVTHLRLQASETRPNIRLFILSGRGREPLTLN